MITTAQIFAERLYLASWIARDGGMTAVTASTDEELARQAQEGDPEAITRLVENNSQRLYAFLVRLTGDLGLAEDLLQETWLRVMERIDRYRPIHPFRTWLYAVARHRAIDLLRQRARRRRRERSSRVIELASDPEPCALERIADESCEKSVARALSTLPVAYREAIVLRFYESLTIDEMARVLKLPTSTVKSRLYRGLEQLRARVEGLSKND
jgi:RNA polymerase sigma-70 factor (ECF subfamily)